MATEPKTDTYGAFQDTTDRLSAFLPILKQGLRVPLLPDNAVAESDLDEYLDWWAEEYQHLRGPDESNFALRIRLFNALRNIRNMGALPTVLHWIAGMLEVRPVIEYAYRGHWAWFPGTFGPGGSATYAIDVDAFISDPFVFDVWVWRTPAGNRWAERSPEEWVSDTLRAAHTFSVFRRPGDPYKMVHAGHATSRAWVQSALSAGTLTSGLEVDADQYIVLQQDGAANGVPQTYTTPVLNLGSDWQSWAWFPDWVVDLKRYGSNSFRVYHRHAESDSGPWSEWEKLRDGHFWSHFSVNYKRYHQLKVELVANQPEDLAIVSLGMKALPPGQVSVAYPDYQEGLAIWGGGG
jgi:hypothetical protein